MATTAYQPGGYPGRPYGSFAGRAAGPVNYTLSCATGVYAYAGGTATLAVTRNYVLTCATGVYVYSGGDADLQVGGALIGRKYPRRGRSRPRKVIPEDIPQAIKEIVAEKDDLAEELAAAQADLVSTQLMAHNNVVRHAGKLKELGEVIDTLQHNINVKREEEVLLMLALMSLAS